MDRGNTNLRIWVSGWYQDQGSELSFFLKSEKDIHKHTWLINKIKRIVGKPTFTDQFKKIYILFFLIWFFTSHQQSCSYKGTGPPGLSQY